jgi:diacylglycerol kinase (ATP)
MRITLMHNPKAGAKESAGKELTDHFESAGHSVNYQSTTQDHYARALEDPADLVAIAGGDGTVAKVALQLVGRNLPFMVVPIGTANNIARALGWEGDPRQLIPMLSSARPVDTHGGLHGGIRLLQDVLKDYQSREFHLWIDRDELSGSFLLLEVMNIPSIGPDLELAPRADPGDGYLDVVLGQKENRQTIEQLLSALVQKREPPALSVRRARKIRWRGPATDLHYDDELWPDKSPPAQDRNNDRGAVQIDVGILPGALKVFVP